jgi:hypothetical protein
MASNRTFDIEVLNGLSAVVQSTLKRATACCPNCDNFKPFNETCGLNSQRPPAPIIAFGCECFVGNQVPF